MWTDKHAFHITHVFAEMRENKSTKLCLRRDTSPVTPSVTYLFLTYDEVSDFTVYVIQLGSSIFTSSKKLHRGRFRNTVNRAL
jgi:hypothetical protein